MARKIKHKGALREIESVSYEPYGPGLVAVLWLKCGHQHRRAKWKMNNRADGRRGIPIKKVHCLKCLNAV